MTAAGAGTRSSFTERAFFSAFLALAVSLILSFTLPLTERVTVPTTVAFLPSLSFLAVFLSTMSWSLSVHDAGHSHGEALGEHRLQLLLRHRERGRLRRTAWAGRRPPEPPQPPPAGRAVQPPLLGALIVTVFVAVAVWPSSSFARTATVWVPGASKRRERLAEAPVCTTASVDAEAVLVDRAAVGVVRGGDEVERRPLGRAGVVDGQRRPSAARSPSA